MLLRKKLLLDTDPGELARVKQILEAAGIRYSVKTTLSENVLSRNLNARSAQYRYAAYSDVSRQSYLYHLYVARRDHARALELIRR